MRINASIVIFAIMSMLSQKNASAQVITINFNQATGSTFNSVFGVDRFHASEYIYKESEIGATNFISTPIRRIGFNVRTVGTNRTFSDVRLYLKNVPLANTTFTSGNYTLAGYTKVFEGSASLNNEGFFDIDLTTTFLRTAGTNLQLLIERTDNITHPGYAFVPSLDDPANVNATNTCRRYNGTTALSSSTILSPSFFRAAVRLSGEIPIDANIVSIQRPGSSSCFSTQQTYTVTLKNDGVSPIAIGAANLSFKITGANSFNHTKANTAEIAPGASFNYAFTGINLTNIGINKDTAKLLIAGDGNTSNNELNGTINTASQLTLTNLSPIEEPAEGTFPLLPFSMKVAGDRQLWNHSQVPYSNSELSGDILPKSQNGFFFLDCFSGASSLNFISRLYSNCVALPIITNGCGISASFWMVQDNSIPSALDSLYFSVSTNKGNTWTRLNGFQRFNSSFTTPTWQQYIIDLSAYAGQTIQIGFEGVSKYGNVIALDQIEVATNCVAPLQWVSFTGSKRVGDHLLEWTTTAESNTLGFEIEKSADGIHFTKIGFTPAKAKNSIQVLSYSFTDKASDVTCFYRLKQVDIDGKSAYSTVVTIKGNFSDKASIRQIFPNPASTQLTATVGTAFAKKGTLSITNLLGKTILQQSVQFQAGENLILLNIANLNSGMYGIKATFEDGVTTQMVKFVKQ